MPQGEQERRACQATATTIVALCTSSSTNFSPICLLSSPTTDSSRV